MYVVEVLQSMEEKEIILPLIDTMSWAFQTESRWIIIFKLPTDLERESVCDNPFHFFSRSLEPLTTVKLYQSICLGFLAYR